MASPNPNTKKNAALIGSGKRVLETALPCFLAAQEHWQLAGMYSRTAKSVDLGPARFEVQALERLDQAQLSKLDLVYLCVSKKAVPAVLARLKALDRSRTDLLIETPVLLFKHLGHLNLLQGWRNVWVSEDCVTLPWLEPIDRAIAAGAIGELKHVVFVQSAFAYHGVALAKRLLGGRVLRGSRQKLAGEFAQRQLKLSAGRGATFFEPRDYGVGRTVWIGSRGVLTDGQGRASGQVHVRVERRGDQALAFHAGDAVRVLDPLEQQLIGPPQGAETLSAWMDGGKRVGFLAFLRQIAAGQGAYPLAEALDDALVDYHLDKLGAYLSNPLTHVRSAPGRALMRLITKASGG
jgi:hypothetical protein